MPGRTPAISVVIPTKNRHSMLAEAIASVLRQDFDDHEIVVVDDGVGAAEFVAEWFAAERSVRCADNAQAGQVGARNLGVSLARGEIVAFLDDDDRWGAKSYLSAVRAAIDGQPAAPGPAKPLKEYQGNPLCRPRLLQRFVSKRPSFVGPRTRWQQSGFRLLPQEPGASYKDCPRADQAVPSCR